MAEKEPNPTTMRTMVRTPNMPTSEDAGPIYGDYSQGKESATERVVGSVWGDQEEPTSVTTEKKE